MNRKLRKTLRWLFGSSKKKTEGPEPNCYVADDTMRPPQFKFEYIELKDIPNMSREKEYKGQWVHFLTRNSGGGLETIEAPRTIGANESPGGLFSALNPPGLEALFEFSLSNWRKAGYVALYVIIAADLFIGFLLVTGGF